MLTLEKFPTVTVDGVTFHVDRKGWPVETCGRCGGSGRYSYCAMYGDTCFGCSGNGITFGGGKAQDHLAAYRDAVARQRLISGHDLAVGMMVRDQHAPKDAPFRTVVTVEDTGKRCGSSKVGNAPEVVYTVKRVTFDDGETVETGSIGWRGKITVDRAPYVEAAQAAYALKIKRSRRRAAA